MFPLSSISFSCFRVQDIQKPIRLHSGIADRLLIARLELDPDAMSWVFSLCSPPYALNSCISDDLDFLPVLASLPQQQTVLEYLVGCWKRLNAVRSNVLKRVGILLPSRHPADAL